MSIWKAQDVADYKSRFNISTSNDDEMIQGLLDAAFSIAEKRTSQTLNRVIGGTAVAGVYPGLSELFFGEGGTSYIPKCQPLYEVKGVTIDGVALTASTGWGVSGYYKDGHHIRLRSYEFTAGLEVTVTYTYGLSPLPEDLRQAIFEIAQIKRAFKDHAGQKSMSGMSKETTTYFDTLPPDILSVLDSHRLMLL